MPRLDIGGLVHLTWFLHVPTLRLMEVHLKPETEARLQAIAAETGRSADDLVQDAMAAYLQELLEVRKMLDSRYSRFDDVASGLVKPIDGDQSFARLKHKSQGRRSGRS